MVTAELDPYLTPQPPHSIRVALYSAWLKIGHGIVLSLAGEIVLSGIERKVRAVHHLVAVATIPPTGGGYGLEVL